MIRKVAGKALVAAIALSVTAAGWLTPMLPGASKAYAEAVAAGDTGIISTYAGGPAVGKSTEVALSPFDVLATEDYIYVADFGGHVVRRIDRTTSQMETVAGNGTLGNSGDGGPATLAQLSFPVDVAVDSKGNLYIVDNLQSIRKVDRDTGLISTLDVKIDAIDGYIFEKPTAIAIDKYDKLYVAAKDRILQIDDNGNASTLASGFFLPYGLALDYNDQGNTIVYVADEDADFAKSAVFMIDSTGAVTTLIRPGALVGDLPLFSPYGLAVDRDHNLYIADRSDNLILKMNGDERITKVETRDVNLSFPTDVFVDGNGDLYIADIGNYMVRKIDAASGIVSTVGGNGNERYSGDGDSALNAQLFEPRAVAVDDAGNIYISDTYNSRIRKVDAVTGIITTIAGTGVFEVTGDGGPATEAGLNEPTGVVVDDVGNVIFIDDYGRRIRKVDAVSKRISTIKEVEEAAGIYLDGKGVLYISFEDGIGKLDPTTGDLGLVYTRGADVDFGSGLAVDSTGNVYFVNTYFPEDVFKIDVDGDVSVYATGIYRPRGMVFDQDDNLYVVDSENAIVRKVYAGGEIVTVVGISESPGYSGDGGPANEAQLRYPFGIAMGSSSDLYITDTDNANVRKVDMPGIPAAALNASAARGSASGTTSVTAAVYEGHKLVVKVSSSSIPTPSVGDWAPTGAGVIAPYTSGTDIGGVDATRNKYVGVYELNQHGKVIAFTQITLTAAQINSPSGSSSGGGFGGGGAGTAPSGNESKSLKIIVNGKEFDGIATAEQTVTNGQTTLTITLNTEKLTAELGKAGDKPVIIIPVTSATDKVSVLLNGEAAMALGTKQGTLEVRTPNGNYTLPMADMIIDGEAKKLVGQAKLADLAQRVDIAKSDATLVKLLEKAAEKGAFKVVALPVDYSVVVLYKGKTIEVDRFASYVKREIPLASGENMTTAVVMERDGEIRHVPTKKIVREGKAYAVVSSLSNSTYALISNTVGFADLEGHWSKDAVNDLASRLVVSGADGRFNPNAAITRAEFAALIVRALGLSDKDSYAEFKDVKDEQWFAGAVGKARKYNIINGYADGTFRPDNTITREEAMAIIARAMNLAGMETDLSGSDAESALSRFADGHTVSNWAKRAVAASVKSGLVKGSEAGLQPVSNITRAEAASIIQRLLKLTELID